ncbi:MAG: hypothetical protein CMJ12_01105 [Pelagibacterales bacterium]|nr:hypothetical protein [Pelagibacterales bacterium]
MYYKTKFFKKLYIATMLLILLNACQFEPVYKNKNLISNLCSIKVREIKPASQIYEINFKNELDYILCDKKVVSNEYILDWSIERRFKELIKSETNFTRRFEETLKIKFNLLDTNNNIIYTDEIMSKGAYNILEDEIISTKASKESLNTAISLNAARLVLDKIYLFMRNK